MSFHFIDSIWLEKCRERREATQAACLKHNSRYFLIALDLICLASLIEAVRR